MVSNLPLRHSDRLCNDSIKYHSHILFPRLGKGTPGNFTAYARGFQHISLVCTQQKPAVVKKQSHILVITRYNVYLDETC